MGSGLWPTKGQWVAGCDEAGRGCLAGPVVAAAVIPGERLEHPLLDDSKKLTPKEREELVNHIKKAAYSWHIATASPAEIDEHNILNASILAMHRALDGLGKSPDLLLIDGNRFKPYRQIPHRCIVGGDGMYRSISAASILAKTHRDGIMVELHAEAPYYQSARNKGYPTPGHRQGIQRHGRSVYHRRSFHLLPKQLKLDW